MMKVFKEWGARFEVLDGELKQWDTGRRVQVTLQNGYTLRELGIQHRRAGSAVMIRPSAEGVANIPNSVLTQDGRINIFATLTTPDGRRITRSEDFAIHVSFRPDDYAGESGGSGGGQLMVELTPVEGHFSFTDRIYTGNKTRDEILKAIYEEGKTVYLSAPYTVDLNTGSIAKQYGLYTFAGQSNANLCFVRIEPDSKTVKGYYLDAITFDGDIFISDSDLSYAANH